MSVWEEDSTTYSGLKCSFHPHCIWCKSPMELFDIKLLNFSLDTTISTEKKSNAIDVVMFCLECGYADTFGVAVSAEHGQGMREKIIKGIKEKTFTHVVSEEKRVN